jgi:Protein of unknown function (DUF732)
MAVRAIALMALAVGLAAPAYADTTDDAFIANLNTSGMDDAATERAIQVAKTVVCGTLSDNPNTSNADLIAKVTSATNWPMVNAAYFTGAAIQAYCPQYGSLDLPKPLTPSKPAAPPKQGVQPASTRNTSPHQSPPEESQGRPETQTAATD